MTGTATMHTERPPASDTPVPSRSRRTALLVAAGMLSAAAIGSFVRPTIEPARGERPLLVLDDLVPRRFGSWAESSGAAQVVNPQQQELLDKLYSQVLTRSYVDATGYRIMLSVAYGDDQRGGLRAHRPEVCYPAQGFALQSNVESLIATPFGAIPGRRLETSLRHRREPVTYWLTAGGTPIRDRHEMRIVELKFALTGRVPDGLLFRVSSIDDDTTRAFERQEAFVADLLKSVSPAGRARLAGLQDPG